MSQWRHEASQRLPELQKTIASPLVHTPSELWMEIWSEFDRLCRETPVPTELLSRIWDYAKSCLDHRDDNVQFAVISHFFQKIRDTHLYREVLPTFMRLEEYERICQS